jgi:Trypsin-like peptidase domain
MKIFRALFLFFSLIYISCTSSYKNIFPTLNDGKYDSEFPYRGVSKQLEEISNSIKRVNCIAFYNSFQLKENSGIAKDKLTDNLVEKNSKKEILFEKTSSGTATILSNDNGAVALLTAAHVVDFPDTILTYFSDENGIFTDKVESISIKKSQKTYIAGFPNGSDVNILLMDKDIDVALLGNKYDPSFTITLNVFNYPNGFAKQLEWGSFVYFFGFPLNYKMISKAIVSSPSFDKNGGFLIDGVVNRGYSGGIVLAVRDGVPNFELVGIVQWMPEESVSVLTPLKSLNEYNELVPYNSDIYVDQLKLYKYGITKVIPIEVIKNYIVKNKKYLMDKGYYLKNFF